jgi:5'-methylthioadenosine phosphorylase
MTTSPEAFLAREAELHYAVMAHVTDYDVWHVSEAPVTVEIVIRILNQNTAAAQGAIRNLLAAPLAAEGCGCATALKDALITNPKRVPAELVEQLRPLIGKYFD